MKIIMGTDCNANDPNLNNVNKTCKEKVEESAIKYKF